MRPDRERVRARGERHDDRVSTEPRARRAPRDAVRPRGDSVRRRERRGERRNEGTTSRLRSIRHSFLFFFFFASRCVHTKEAAARGDDETQAPSTDQVVRTIVG